MTEKKAVGSGCATLVSFLAATEELHASLSRADGQGSSSAFAIERVLSCSTELHAGVMAAFHERDARRRCGKLHARAAVRQSELLALAHSMRTADVRLDCVVRRSRDALADADASAASARHVPPTMIVECAERVSYSNAAPCGDAAFEGARRHGWYHGWGSPAPQQHMLANSLKICPTAEGGVPTSRASDGTSSTPRLDQTTSLSMTDLPDAPAYTAVAPAQQQQPTAERVSLGFNSDDDEDDS